MSPESTTIHLDTPHSTPDPHAWVNSVVIWNLVARTGFLFVGLKPSPLLFPDKEFKAWWASSDRYEQLEAHEQASIENKQYGEWMEGVIAHFKSVAIGIVATSPCLNARDGLRYFDKDHSGFVEGDEWDAMHKHLSDGGYPVGKTPTRFARYSV